MPVLMKEDQNLSFPGIARVRPHVGPARTTMAHNHALLPDFNHHRHGIKKRSVGVDGDGSVPSVALENFGDIRIPENGGVIDGVRRFLDKLFPVAV